MSKALILNPATIADTAKAINNVRWFMCGIEPEEASDDRLDKILAQTCPDCESQLSLVISGWDDCRLVRELACPECGWQEGDECEN